jgi:hypothetical protein
VVKRSWFVRAVILAFAVVLAIPWGAVGPAEARDPGNPQDFYGMVGRDPWYEYSTDPERYPNQINRSFLENMVSDMAEMGVGWIRIEMRAEVDEPEGPGRIDWSKHDWFINDLAPRYGIKVLALLGSGVLGDKDKTYEFQRINDPPDQNGRNHYTEAFVERVGQIAGRYGSNIAAYEILNEPNANLVLHRETSGEVKEVHPLIYGRLAIDSYEAIKAASPGTQVVAGTILHDNNEGMDLHFDWLRRVYESSHIQSYASANGTHPWDGVSIHPYFLDANGVVHHMWELRAIQDSFGDTSGIWITEIGLPASPPGWSSHGIMDPSPSELEQAQFLEAIYTRLKAETPFVSRVFWFKYEDFGVGTYANWGLVRLRDSNFRYGPSAKPWPRKYGYSVYQRIARPDRAPTHPRPAPPDEGPRVRYFPQTGHTLRDPFLRYWEQHGGLAMFGYPKTTVFAVQGRKVQYFERARFEYWPEHIGTQWEVQLGLLGRYETRHRTFEPQPPPDNNDNNNNRVYYPQTQQYLGGAFRRYWENNGGLDIFGYPISPEFEEVNPADGQTYVVQYFERARFEWHPEHEGTPHEVQLGLLGNQVLANPGWYR